MHGLARASCCDSCANTTYSCPVFKDSISTHCTNSAGKVGALAVTAVGLTAVLTSLR